MRRNATEYLYAFTGFLTSREKPIIFSKHHNAAPIAELVAEFIKANRMPKPRPDWPAAKTPPQITNHITNERLASVNNVAEVITPEGAEKRIMRLLYELPKSHQDAVLAGVLSHMKRIRTERLEDTRKTLVDHEVMVRQAEEHLQNLINITRGDVTVIHKTHGNG